MEQQDKNQVSNKVNKITYKKDVSLTYNFIIIIIALFLLLLESTYIIVSCIKNGIFKKEILTENSNIGFDIIIKS